MFAICPTRGCMYVDSFKATNEFWHGMEPRFAVEVEYSILHPVQGSFITSLCIVIDEVGSPPNISFFSWYLRYSLRYSFSNSSILSSLSSVFTDLHLWFIVPWVEWSFFAEEYVTGEDALPVCADWLWRLVWELVQQFSVHDLWRVQFCEITTRARQNTFCKIDARSRMQYTWIKDTYNQLSK